MARYSEAFKEAIIKKLNESGMSARAFAKQEGLVLSSLYNWQRKYGSSGNTVPKSEKVSGKTQEEKFSIVVKTATMSEVELGEYCRENGLYPEKVKEWKQAFINQDSTGGERKKEDAKERKADKKRIRELEKELKRKNAALAETAALLVLQKKLNAYWGEDEEN